MLRITVVLIALALSSADIYCPGRTSGNQQSGDSNLGPVRLQGFTKSIDEEHNCPGGTGVQYFPNDIADIYPGQALVLDVSVTTCSNAYNRKTAAWIDFNGNQKYETWEQIGEGSVDASSKDKILYFNFTVPSKAVANATSEENVVWITTGSSPNLRLRVVVIENGFDPVDPCIEFPYGGLKEFPIWAHKFDYCENSLTPGAVVGNQQPGDSNLGPVRLQGSTTSIDEEHNCPGGTGVQYFANDIADVYPGQTLLLNVSVTTCGSAYPRKNAAWIDFNGNRKFETWEKIGEQDVDASSKDKILYFNFTVPSKAVADATSEENVVWITTGSSPNLRLRVQVVEKGFGPADPCLEFPYGGVKDFPILAHAFIDNYCPAGAGNRQAQDSTIGPVSLQGATKSIDEEHSCPGGKGVQYFPNDIADVYPGQTLVLNVSVTTCNRAYKRVNEAWIDFNGNSKYETWEKIGQGDVGAIAGDNILYFRFTVPNKTVTEATSEENVVWVTTERAPNLRLRVMSVENGNLPLDPCFEYPYGGLKEFPIWAHYE